MGRETGASRPGWRYIAPLFHIGIRLPLTARRKAGRRWAAASELGLSKEELEMNREENMRVVRKNKELVFRFVELINRGDSTSLAEMMADGFRFIDTAGEVFTVNDRSGKKRFWNDYFQGYPQYSIVMDLMLSSGTDIAFIGKTCDSHIPRSVEINETLMWFAGIVGDQVSEWRIFSTEGYAL